MLVQKQKVDIIGVQAGEHFIYRCRRLALAIFAWPQFGGNPYIFAGNAARLYRRAYAALVLIYMGGINAVKR